MYRFLSIAVLVLFSFATKNSIAEEESNVGVANFAFSSYLGTGFYTSSGQNVFVIKLPFEHTIKAKTDTEAGWVLNLPITIGLFNFSNINIENIPEVEDIGTITFLPGIEYRYPVFPNWTVIPFADYGFAREINLDNNVLVTGVGIKSYADFNIKKIVLTLGNKFLYARERTKNTGNDSDYSLIETGLNFRLLTKMTSKNGPVYTNFYYINFYYPNNLVFFERTTTPIVVGVENELGFTFSNLPDIWFFEKPQLGLGARFGNNVTVYRLIFGMPF